VVEFGTGGEAPVGATTSWWWAFAADSQCGRSAEQGAEVVVGVALAVGAGGDEEGAVGVSVEEVVVEVAVVELLGGVERSGGRERWGQRQWGCGRRRGQREGLGRCRGGRGVDERGGAWAAAGTRVGAGASVGGGGSGRGPRRHHGLVERRRRRGGGRREASRRGST